MSFICRAAEENSRSDINIPGLARVHSRMVVRICSCEESILEPFMKIVLRGYPFVTTEEYLSKGMMLPFLRGDFPREGKIVTHAFYDFIYDQ